MPKRNRTPTTSLPPTLIEAEAIEFARRHIASVRDGKLNLVGVGAGKWFEGGESRRVCELMFRDWILSGPLNLMMAVRLARAGYEPFEEVLRKLILEYKLADRYADMPVYLRGFDIDMDVTAGVRLPKRTGPRRYGDTLRDVVVALLVNRVAERFSLKPTRNRASHKPSACSVVARALELERMAMSERNVVQLWQAISGVFSTGSCYNN